MGHAIDFGSGSTAWLTRFPYGRPMAQDPRMTTDHGQHCSNLDAFNSPLGPALDLTPTADDRLEGFRDSNPVLVRRIYPMTTMGGIGAFRNRSTYKTEIQTRFRATMPIHFFVHGRGPVLFGDHHETGDPSWDSQFIIRSKTGPQVLALFNPQVRASTRTYDASVPSLELTDKGADVLIEGDIPSAHYLNWILTAQTRLLNLIVYSGKQAGLLT